MSITYLEWAEGAYPGADFTVNLAAGEYVILGQIAVDYGSFDGVALYLDTVELGDWETDDASGQAILETATVTAGSHVIGLYQRDSAGSDIPHQTTDHGSIVIISVDEAILVKTWPSHTVGLGGTAAMSLLNVETAADETITVLGVQLEAGRLRVKVDGVTFPTASDPIVEQVVMWSVTPGAGTHAVGIEIEAGAAAGHGGVVVFGGSVPGPVLGGQVEDGDTGSMGAIFWFYVMPEADFAALTPGAWAPDTFYIPGALIFEDGSYWARTALGSRLSHSVGNEPNWTSVTEGTLKADLGGYWLRLADAFDVTDPLEAWAASVALAAGEPGPTPYYGKFIAAGGHVYIADVSDDTGPTEPAWPTDPCAGIDRFYIGGGAGSVQAYPLCRPYVAASVVVTRNGSPESVTELDPDTAMIEVDATTWAFADLIVVTYTAVCP